MSVLIAVRAQRLVLAAAASISAPATRASSTLSTLGTPCVPLPIGVKVGEIALVNIVRQSFCISVEKFQFRNVKRNVEIGFVITMNHRTNHRTRICRRTLRLPPHLLAHAKIKVPQFSNFRKI